MTITKAVRISIAAIVLSVAVNASTIFNFDGDSLGTSTNFTDTVNGLSATFSSPADPGGFVVYSSMFETLTGNVLGDPGPAGLDNLALTINFSQNLSAITLDFATADFITPSPLTITAYENSTLVGSNTLPGMFLNGFTFPEGEIAFSGLFNQVVISSTATDFAVDNINVITASPTPEPAAFALFGGGLLALGLPVLRRKSACRETRK
jgi:hypothetical protein